MTQLILCKVLRLSGFQNWHFIRFWTVFGTMHAHGPTISHCNCSVMNYGLLLQHFALPYAVDDLRARPVSQISVVVAHLQISTGKCDLIIYAGYWLPYDFIVVPWSQIGHCLTGWPRVHSLWKYLSHHSAIFTRCQREMECKASFREGDLVSDLKPKYNTRTLWVISSFFPGVYRVRVTLSVGLTVSATWKVSALICLGISRARHCKHQQT